MLFKSLILVTSLFNITSIDASELNRVNFAESLIGNAPSIGEVEKKLGEPDKKITKKVAARHNQIKSELTTMFYSDLTISIWKGQFTDGSSKEIPTNITYESCLFIQTAPCFIGYNSTDLIKHFGNPNSNLSSKKSIIYMVPFGDAGYAPIEFKLKDDIVKSVSISNFIE